MDNDFVKEQLIKCGHKNVTDELVIEFLEKLQNEEEIPIRPSGLKYCPFAPFPKVTTKKRNDLSHRERIAIGKNVGFFGKEFVAIKKETPIVQQKFEQKSKQPGKKKDEYQDEELIILLKILENIKNKANILDSLIQQCQIDIARNAGVANRTKKAEKRSYPITTVKKKTSNCCFKRPPIQSSRKSKVNNRRKLLIEKKITEYFPPPEKRNNTLRWQIRQKLIRSDPRYL